MTLLKIGELARRTGLSVRTLHHYEHIGLLIPAQRSASGHRLYGSADIARLHRIIALKQIGMSLEEIGRSLSNPHFGVREAVQLQRARVRGQIQLLHSIDQRLELIENRMRSADDVSVDDILDALEAMAMFEKYYTPEQLAYLERRRTELGEDAIKSAEKEWPELIAKVRSAMERGVDPSSEEVQALSRRWNELIEAFTGGDPGIAASLSNMYRNEPSLGERNGMDPTLMRYVHQAWQRST